MPEGIPNEAPAGDWAQVQELFERMRHAPPADRPALLDRACGDDHALRRLVERLLDAHDRSDAFLDALDPVRAAALLTDPGDATEPDPTVEDPAEPPSSVGRYEVLRPLGRGGMGRVYLARDPALDRPVALKLLRSDRDTGRRSDRRLVREARAASALDHPNIGTVYEVGVADGGPYIAMAYYDGETLRQRLARGPLEIGEAVELARQVADGLAAAHEHGIVHRDIKPANLIMTTRGLVKIVDFGVAAVASHTTTAEAAPIGTAAYMSPEQTRGDRADPRTDVWALGVVLYEALAGVRPFPGETPDVVIYGIRHDEPTPLEVLRSDLPPALAATIQRCLEKEPEARFASAATLVEALADTKNDPEATTPRRRRRWRAAPAALAAALALVALLAATTFLPTGGGNRSGAALATPWAEREPLILADFGASTADPRIGRVVTEALRIDLLQSPALRLAETQEVTASLRRMGRDPAEGVAEPEAREMALREGYKAVVVGEVAALGAGYLLTARMVDAASGATVAALRETAADSLGLIDAVDRLSKGLREQAGESLAALEAATPLPRVATASLPALRRYAEGSRVGWAGGDQTRAAALFAEAVDLDSTFAAAHRALSIAYWNIRADRSRTVAATRRAYELRHRLSERERYFVEATYHWHVRGDPERTAEAYRRLLALDPHHPAGRTNLGLALLFTGEAGEAERVLRAGSTPGAPGPDALRLNTARALYFQGRSAAALVLIDSIAERPGGSPAADILRARLLGGEGRWDDAENAARTAIGRHGESPYVRAEALRILWHLALVRGRLRRADSIAGDLLPLLDRLGMVDAHARSAIQHAEARRTLWGDAAGARHHLLDLVDDPELNLLRAGATLAPRAAAALAAVGETDRALRLVDAWQALPADDRGDPDHFSPELARARVDLSSGRHDEAALRLQRAAAGTIQAIHYLPDLARAHQLAGRTDSAIAVIDRYLAFRHTRRLHRVPPQLGPLLALQAELHQTAGDTTRALAAYAALIDLWESADTELQPRVDHARRRLAELSQRDG